MVALLITLALAGTPQKMAAPSFTVEGIFSKLAQAWQDRLLGRLASPDLKITSASDVEALFGLERQRQLLGCDDHPPSG